MRHNHSGRAGRAGFTLIELLIVMAIIATLVSLTAAAVYKVIGLGPRTACRTEIGELETAIRSFQNRFNVDYIPSRIKLCQKMGSYTNAPLDVDSKDYLLRVFPKLNNNNYWTTTGIRWHSSWPPGGSQTATLEGHQCLVFFLGGIPVTNPNGCVGFSTSPNDPSVLGGDRIPPFYDFKSSRLTTDFSGGNNFFSYLDPFPKAKPVINASGNRIDVPAKPYAYFSHYKASNGYSRYATLTPPSDNNILDRLDTPNPPIVGLRAGPYALANTPTPRYYKPDSFEIISAGPDALFGPGGVFSPSDTSGLGTGGEGRDNMTNFTPGRLEGGE
jgi:prepilin-type N-terminal cleavage/methylation domain-containing protein